MSKIAFLFPGQGSQYAGMLANASQYPVMLETVEQASDTLGYDVAALLKDETKLAQTVYTQPALLTASIALLRLWREHAGIEASTVAGHSLGEYSALVAAKVLNFEDALRLVAFRGQVMTDAVAEQEGKMAAILGLERIKIDELCAQISRDSDKVWAANDNCPGQIVVAGHAAAVDRFMDVAQAEGARRVLALNVSVPSHTPLMQSAANAMEKKCLEVVFNEADCPVWSNALAVSLQDPEQIRVALVQQLIKPVRWNESMHGMLSSGVDAVVEMGSGKVLTGLMRRIDRKALALATDHAEQLLKSLERVGEHIG
ncbi:MAG: ACP S-malonyltransferase [Mariprofundaceae bacterium]|nr:ACP S-malonyltransferase [Mariprofundaceae bacterium]